MTENHISESSLLPVPAPEQRNQQHTVYASDQGPPRRNNKNRRPQKQVHSSIDGSISDSVALPATSPRPKKASQSRSHAQPVPINHSGKKPRQAVYNGNGPPATPAKEQAYAGSTFQASPAASSLPLPRMFSRPMSNSNDSSSARPESANSLEPKQVSPQPRAVAASFLPPESSRQSPLDLFFEADRVERGKNRTQSDSKSPQFARHPEPAPIAERGEQEFRNEQAFSQVSHSQSQPSSQRIPQEQLTRSLKDLLFNTASPQPPATPPSFVATPPHGQQGFGPSSPSPFVGPRSGPSTPLANPEQQRDYSFHYGNRNLSPLFQAARDDTPSRPSHLRRELSSDGTVIASPQRHSGTIDPNVFSRQYLHQHIGGAPVPRPPPGPQPASPFSSGYSSSLPASATTDFSRMSPSQLRQPSERGYDASHNQSMPKSAAGGDVRSMEEDIRRMLNLNLMSK